MKALRQGSVSIALFVAAQSRAGPSRLVSGVRQLRGSGQNGSVSGGEDAGRPVLRIAGPDDAAALMKLKQRLDEETSLMHRAGRPAAR